MGEEKGRGKIGGKIEENMDGKRRMKEGDERDNVMGVSVV